MDPFVFSLWKEEGGGGGESYTRYRGSEHYEDHWILRPNEFLAVYESKYQFETVPVGNDSFRVAINPALKCLPGPFSPAILLPPSLHAIHLALKCLYLIISVRRTKIL